MPLSTVSAVLTRIGLGKLSRLEPLEPANRYESSGRASSSTSTSRSSCGSSGPATASPATGSGSRKGDRLGVRPRLRRRRHPPRLRRGPRRREGRHRGRLPAPRGRPLRRLRHPGAASDDRQRLRLPLDRPRARLPRRSGSNTSAPAPTGPAPTAKPNASSAPCSAAGPTAPSTATSSERTRRPCRLARLLQSPTTTRQPQPPTTPDPATRDQEQQEG